MINIRSNYHPCRIQSARSDKTLRTENPDKQWECWKINNLMRIKKPWGGRDFHVQASKKKGDLLYHQEVVPLLSRKMRATAAGESAAGYRQPLTAGLASSPAEGQSGPEAVGVV